MSFKLVSHDVKDMLHNTLNLVYGVNLFVDFEPDEPNECVSIYATGGPGPDLATGGFHENTLMIRIRGEVENEVPTYAIAESVRDALHRRAKAVVNESTYHMIISTGDINPLGRDEVSRPVYSVNFRIQRSQ